MTAHAEALLREVLLLPPEERVAFVARVKESLHPEADPDLEAAWDQEIRRRVRDMEEGKVEMVDWEDLLPELEAP